MSPKSPLALRSDKCSINRAASTDACDRDQLRGNWQAYFPYVFRTTKSTNI